MKQETQNKAIKNPSKHLVASTAKITQHFQTGKFSTHHSWFGYYFRRKVIKRRFAAPSKTLHTHRRLTNRQRQRWTWTIFLTPLGKLNLPRQVATKWLQKFIKTEALSGHALTLGSPGETLKRKWHNWPARADNPALDPLVGVTGLLTRRTTSDVGRTSRKTSNSNSKGKS